MASVLGYLAGLGIAGALTDSDTDDSNVPWYLSAALTFLFIIAGVTLALAVLTKVGFLSVITDLFKSYLSFVTDLISAIAEPVLRFIT
jgi:hypothetical protein